MSIGKNIKSTRNKLGLTQTELASKTNLSKQTIYKYENEIVTNIPSDKIERIAKALETSPQYLMGWDEKALKKAIKQTEEEQDMESVRSMITRLGYKLTYTVITPNDSSPKIIKDIIISNSDKIHYIEYSDFKEFCAGVEAFSKFQLSLLFKKSTILKPAPIESNNLEPMAAHNNNTDEEQLNLMKEDLDEL